MTWMIHSGCRYHTQDTAIGCGAAAAMMILEEIGVPYSDLDQDDLYTSNHDHNRSDDNWATDPYGLEWTLDHRRPPGAYGFAVFKPLSEPEGTRQIVHTLHKYEVSPAALINRCRHWIVVPGVMTDVEPVSGADYEIQGFWIHNPVHHAGEPPPPHNATDDCGSGGDLGVANDWVSYADWQGMFTGCDYDDPAGNRQYISVCDPKETKINLPRRLEMKYLVDGRKILSRKDAVKFSQEGLDKFSLLKEDRIAAAIKNARSTEPHLVSRLDQPNTYYYLVPWIRNREISAYTRLDARFGTFLGVHLMGKPREDKRRYRLFSKEDVHKLIAYKRIEMPKYRGRLKVFPEAVSISPTLVWRPCPESYSPSLPFYQCVIGDATFYVRTDGKIYTQLSIEGPKGD